MGLVDPDSVQMLALPDPKVAGEQHDSIAEAYKSEGVTVHFIDPLSTPTPNLMFVADLMFMTPEGAIVGRPPSTVRAGEERWVARRLADIGVPIRAREAPVVVEQSCECLTTEPAICEEEPTEVLPSESVPIVDIQVESSIDEPEQVNIGEPLAPELTDVETKS